MERDISIQPTQMTGQIKVDHLDCNVMIGVSSNLSVATSVSSYIFFCFEFVFVLFCFVLFFSRIFPFGLFSFIFTGDPFSLARFLRKRISSSP